MWSPDGRWIAFQSDARRRPRHLPAACRRHRRCGAADDTGGQVTQHAPENPGHPTDVHLSLRHGLAWADWTGLSALWMLTLSDRQTTAVVRRRLVHRDRSASVFSPDGKWLAYGMLRAADVANVNRGVFLQSFPGDRSEVSSAAGKSWTSIRCGRGQEAVNSYSRSRRPRDSWRRYGSPPRVA